MFMAVAGAVLAREGRVRRVLWVSPGLRGSVVEKMVRDALLNVRRERSVGRTYTAE